MPPSLPVDLPTRPLTISEAHALAQHDGIAHAAPVIGLTPTPLEAVIGLYLGIDDTATLVGFGTDNATWTVCATTSASAIGTSATGSSEYRRALQELLTWLEHTNPGRTFAMLEDKRPAGA
jgi:hypothetical protein